MVRLGLAGRIAIFVKNTLKQLVRYGAVGVLSNAVGYLLYLAITSLGMEPKLAMTFLYAVGVAMTFFFNKRWSFRHGGSHGPAFVRYCFSSALGYAINLLALYTLVDRFRYPHQIVQAIMICIVAIMMFALNKFWVFQPSLAGSNLRGTDL